MDRSVGLKGGEIRRQRCKWLIRSQVSKKTRQESEWPKMRGFQSKAVAVGYVRPPRRPIEGWSAESNTTLYSSTAAAHHTYKHADRVETEGASRHSGQSAHFPDAENCHSFRPALSRSVPPVSCVRPLFPSRLTLNYAYVSVSPPLR